MDENRKRELKKLAKIAIDEESRRLRDVLQKTNKAPFASDEYLRNEISIRREEARMRQSPRCLTMRELNEKYVVKEHAFNGGLDYPLNHTAFWFCAACDVAVPSRPRSRLSCSCGKVGTGFPWWEILLARIVFFARGRWELVRNNGVGWSEFQGAEAIPIFVYPQR